MAGVLDLCSPTTDKGIFQEMVSGLLDEKPLVSGIELTCSSKFRHLDVDEKIKVEETIRREYLGVTNAQIGFTRCGNK